MVGDVSCDMYEGYVHGVTYDIKDLVSRTRPFILNNFQRFLDSPQFLVMVRNCSLYDIGVELIKTAMNR